MKNKTLLFIVVLILIVSFVGCSTEKVINKNDNPNQAVENTDNNNDKQVEKSGEVTSQDSQKQDTDEQKEQAKETNSFDKSLSGKELLGSIKGNRPKTMRMESEMISFGTASKIITYYDADNTRTETNIAGVGESILIYLADEEVMYSYLEGEAEGVKMTGANTEYAEEMGLMIDTTSLFAEITDQSSEAMTATVENLGGEEVVYIEATEADEEIGQVLVKMWYSVKYHTPLKYEVFMGESRMMQLNVTKVEKDVKIDKALFTPPSNVSFKETDMEAMMDMEEMMDIDF